MQAAPARYVSVSELYSTDEVELLLDEIRELEPTSCRGEDLQDFEIAGSGCSGAGPGGGGGRSPGSLAGTERSWDSHAQYRRALVPRGSGVALYWRPRRLLSAPALCALLALACCGAAAGCVWAGVGLRLGALPLAGRVQLLQAAALSALLLHASFLAGALAGLDSALAPAPAARAALRVLAAAAAAALAAGAAATLAALHAPAYTHAPPHLARLLYSAAGLALGGACASGALAGISGGGWRCACAGAGAGAGAEGGRTAAAGGAYRAVPPAPPAAPSTSRDHPL